MRIPPGERIAGLAVMVSLILIGGWVAWRGGRAEPLRLGASPGMEAPQQGGEAANGILTGALPLEAMLPVEHYTADTLYEKINGRAPLYLDFGFESLECRSFAVAAHPREFVDVLLFRMRDPLAAFGIYSTENAGQGAPLSFVEDGRGEEMGCAFRRGSVYVQVTGSSSSAPVREAVDRMARHLAAGLPGDQTGLEAKRVLPVEGRVPGSIRYLAENAYGHAVLKGVFEADYALEGGTVPLFAMVAESPRAAAAALDALRTFYGRFGTVVLDEPDRLIGESFGQLAALRVEGAVVRGGMAFPSESAARAWLEAADAAREGSP